MFTTIARDTVGMRTYIALQILCSPGAYLWYYQYIDSYEKETASPQIISAENSYRMPGSAAADRFTGRRYRQYHLLRYFARSAPDYLLLTGILSALYLLALTLSEAHFRRSSRRSIVSFLYAGLKRGSGINPAAANSGIIVN